MKTIKIIGTILAATVLFSSCMEKAETAYLSEDRRQEIDKEKTLSYTVNGMYNDIQQYVKNNLSHNYFGQKSFDYLTSLMGNDMIMTGRFGMSIYHYLLDYYQENYGPTDNRWSEYYNHIANANKMLKDIDSDEESGDILYYKAVALGFRAYAYLQLTYLYQHAYYTGVEGTPWGKGKKYDFSKEPCVPLILETTEGDQSRSSVEDVYKQIIEDLESAYKIFESLGCIHTDDPTDIDGCVVAMHLARAYMITHQWDDAIKYAQVIIDEIPILKTESEILQGFSDINLSDVVFGSDITIDNSTVYMSWFSQMDVYGAGYAAIGVWRAGFKPLVDRIDDNDVRLKWFCCDRSTGIDVDGKRKTMLRDTKVPAYVEYQSVKFIGAGRNAILSGYDPDKGASGWELGDYIYLRSEEAHLIKAEALAHKDESEDAVATLNDFMQTRQSDYNYTYKDKASLIEEIIYQKRVEFWGEGLEYLDNRRLNIPVDRTDATWGESNNHYAAARFKKEQEDKAFVYQLPISEIENSTALTEADQN